MTSLTDLQSAITPETLTLFCNTNESLLPADAPVRAIIVELPGLGGSSCLGGCVDFGEYVTDSTREFAEKGILVLYIFPGPWSWGNRGAVRITDAVVSAAMKKYSLSEGVPLTVCGGSMGGMGALLYAADSARKVTAVCAACPGTDTLAAYERMTIFRRTYISAVADYDLPLSAALRSISPIERLGDMPRVPYFICSDGEDDCFPEAECDLYVQKLRALGMDVTYYRQPGLPHGHFSKEAGSALHQFLLASSGV